MPEISGVSIADPSNGLEEMIEDGELDSATEEEIAALEACKAFITPFACIPSDCVFIFLT